MERNKRRKEAEDVQKYCIKLEYNGKCVKSSTCLLLTMILFGSLAASPRSALNCCSAKVSAQLFLSRERASVARAAACSVSRSPHPNRRSTLFNGSYNW